MKTPTSVQLETGQYGPRTIVTCWSDEVAAFLGDHPVAELELNDGKGWRGTDVEFLRTLPHLQAFAILDLRIGSVEAVHSLHELRALTISTYCRTPLDFSAFPHLDTLALEWRAGVKALFDCTTLKSLFLNRYKGKDTAPFGRLPRLESLAILNAPIADLAGLAPLSRLRRLRLANLRRLASLAGIEGLAQLEELDVNTCRAIPSIAPVARLTGLRKLFVNNCGDIESLAPLDSLPQLEWFLFWESTNIVDGDLTPLTRLRHLERVTFQNRRHYSHRREEFEAYTGDR